MNDYYHTDVYKNMVSEWHNNIKIAIRNMKINEVLDIQIDESSTTEDFSFNVDYLSGLI